MVKDENTRSGTNGMVTGATMGISAGDESAPRAFSTA
jgi:hypothetical protein